jgi:hypothetical protein
LPVCANSAKGALAALKRGLAGFLCPHFVARVVNLFDDRGVGVKAFGIGRAHSRKALIALQNPTGKIFCVKVLSGIVHRGKGFGALGIVPLTHGAYATKWRKILFRGRAESPASFWNRTSLRLRAIAPQ